MRTTYQITWSSFEFGFGGSFAGVGGVSVGSSTTSFITSGSGASSLVSSTVGRSSSTC